MLVAFRQIVHKFQLLIVIIRASPYDFYAFVLKHFVLGRIDLDFPWVNLIDLLSDKDTDHCEVTGYYHQRFWGERIEKQTSSDATSDKKKTHIQLQFERSWLSCENQATFI